MESAIGKVRTAYGVNIGGVNARDVLHGFAFLLERHCLPLYRAADRRLKFYFPFQHCRYFITVGGEVESGKLDLKTWLS